MARARPPLLVSAAIILKNGQVLIGQRRKNDRHPYKWEFPGGKVELGESPREALVRELREELEVEARIGAELARYEHEYPGGSRVHLLFFGVAEYSGEPKARVFERISWVKLADLPAVDFLEGDIDFVRRLARGDFNEQLTTS